MLTEWWQLWQNGPVTDSWDRMVLRLIVLTEWSRGSRQADAGAGDRVAVAAVEAVGAGRTALGAEQSSAATWKQQIIHSCFKKHLKLYIVILSLYKYSYKLQV